MLYVDYTWDLDKDRLLLDRDLDTSKLGWHTGDIFKLVDINGQQVLRRMDPLQAFLQGDQINE